MSDLTSLRFEYAAFRCKLGSMATIAAPGKYEDTTPIRVTSTASFTGQTGTFPALSPFYLRYFGGLFPALRPVLGAQSLRGSFGTRRSRRFASTMQVN